MGIVVARFSQTEAWMLKDSAEAHELTISDIVRGLIWQAISDRAVAKYRRSKLDPLDKNYHFFKIRLPKKAISKWNEVHSTCPYGTSNAAVRSLLWAYPLVEVRGKWVLPVIRYPDDWEIK